MSLFKFLCGLVLVQHMACVRLLIVNPKCHICFHGRNESSSLLRWSKTRHSRGTCNENHCEGNLKTILRSGWILGHYHLETKSAQGRPLFSHINAPSTQTVKTNTPTHSTIHWGTDYEPVHNTNRECTIIRRPPQGHLNSGVKQSPPGEILLPYLHKPCMSWTCFAS